jgi:hypothetical protein
VQPEPEPPHERHWPDRQCRLPQHNAPGEHAASSPPHFGPTQTPPSQAALEQQVSDAAHDEPTATHAAHWPDRHSLPEQQGWVALQASPPFTQVSQ